MIEEVQQRDPYRFSRFVYIIEAALEYFITIMASGAYLATLTTSIGMSDSQTGILSSFVSLGVSFQILAIFLCKGKTKKWRVIPVEVLVSLLFTMLYVVPLFNIPSRQKIVLIFVFMLSARIISKIIYSLKMTWLMGLVDEHKRGKFTAVKEIVSLISGMAFTMIMGTIADYYESINNMTGYFTTCAITLFALSLLHTLSLVITKESSNAEAQSDDKSIEKPHLSDIFKNKTFWKIMPVFMLWYIAWYASSPFYGTYTIGELSFTMTAVSLISILAALTRAFASLPFGMFADKHGFAKMLVICYLCMFVAFLSMSFASPQTRWLYIVYSTVHAIGMAGMNSGELNLILDYTSRKLRVEAIAISGLVTGLLGFLTTLAMKSLVDHIQKNGNTFLGMHIYAQQVISAISAICCILAILYLTIVVKHMKRNV